MKIRRIRLVLPARMKGRAAADARQIAEAVGAALASGGAVSGPLVIPGAGRTGVALAVETSARIAAAGSQKGKIV